MVAKASNSEKEHASRKKKIKNLTNKIYSKNLSWLVINLEKLPENLKEKINSFRLKHKRIYEQNPQLSINSPFTNNKTLVNELETLVDEICTYLSVPTVGYSHALMWYILHDKFKPPGANFIISIEDDSVDVKFIKKPTHDDYKLLKIFINEIYKRKPESQNKHYHPFLAKTVLRKQQNSLSSNTWDKIDTDDNAFHLENEIQKRNLSKQDKHRMKKYLRDK